MPQTPSLDQSSAASDQLDWAKGDGLLPAIVQDVRDGRVLMLGYMNQAALEKSLKIGKVTFHSRSKNRLWTKGETSGNSLQLVSITPDCDRDTLLVQAVPTGPVCHLGTATCFGDLPASGPGFLAHLEQTINERASTGDDTSYTARLLAEGVERCAQKVGEEGVEVALAAVSGNTEKLNSEAADLLYHLLVCLKSAGSDLNQVIEQLQSRHR
ncbi:MAG: bifunctional phosphoribosyl-AMP cyclohydrolase/phosphoribosyl-ATP diphosphatase HisIE [Wenzhouxiangella sp.]